PQARPGVADRHRRAQARECARRAGARRRPGRSHRGRRRPPRAAPAGRGTRRVSAHRQPRRRPDRDPGGASGRAVIAEDLALLRDGLTRLLRDNEIEVVAAVGDGDALVLAVLRERPDIAIVDIRMPPTFRDEGLRAALTLRESAPETAVLIISQYVEGTYA